MNRIIKSIALNFLSKCNVYPAKFTDKQDIINLIDILRPVTSGKELVRMGPVGDGGYLVPDDLDGIEACFSPGVAELAGFELDCANLGMKVFLADKSVQCPPEDHELFHFTSKFVGVTTNDEFMTIDDWVESMLPGSHKDILLQIDVERFEYEVFLAMTDKLMNRFRIIVVEFHSMDQLWNKPYFSIASRVFDKIMQTHSCVHHHPNNCVPPVKIGDIKIPLFTELTFLRKDRVKEPTFIKSFPHPLDSDNTDNPSQHLPECWYL